ncbi:hypothetical protein ACKWTF_000147 [Chironomus riparius]
MDINSFNHTFLHFYHTLLMLLLLNHYVTIAYHDDTHNVAKRLDVDVCAENFKIHSSTIIRTEESKAMGAKFLNDEEVASNEACMKMCCATDECDVFIYEEKSSGTCFLFHCGLSDDFRCKFTSHTNYTSGILTVTRNELQSMMINQITDIAVKPKLSQNELDLVSLKRPSSYQKSSELIALPSSTSTIPPLGVRLSDVSSTQTTTKSPSSLSSSSVCGRFQFQCQTSKECIAIYNVCDQIAQCEDGSDEGPECPTTNSVTVKSILTGVENQPKLDNQISRNRLVSSMNDNFNQMAHPIIHNREDPMSAPKYSQNHVAQYMDTDSDSHIFSHKNNLLSGNNFPNIQYQQKFQRDPYMMPQTQQGDDQVYHDQLQMTRNDWPQMPQMPPQPQQQAVMPQMPKQSNPVWSEKLPKQIIVEDKVVSNKKQQQQKDSDYSEEYVEGDESQSDGEDVTTTVAPKKKTRKHKKQKAQQKEKQVKVHEKPLHEQLKQLKNTVNDDAQFISEYSERIEKPTGAILSLTLGCLVLVALSILVGCRMKRVHVRRRRHGKAVDADFLVNGMYL